jgi:ribosomal protein S18 acetylase RimI-like enzyme
MEKINYTIRPLLPNDLEDATLIHLEGIPYSLNALCGKKHLQSIYGHLIQSGLGVVFGAFDNQNNKLMATVTLSSSPKALKKYLANHLKFMNKILLVIALIKNPKEFFYLFDSLFFNPYPLEKKYGVLFSIIVKNEYKGLGLGSALIQKASQYFKEEQIKLYCLETRIYNKEAQVFYEKKGFKKLTDRYRDLFYIKEL